MIGAILLQILLIFLNATFASAEIAVLSMNETKLKKMADDSCENLEAFLNTQNSFFETCNANAKESDRFACSKGCFGSRKCPCV